MDKKVRLNEKEAKYICQRGTLELLNRASVGKIVTQGFVFHLKSMKDDEI